MYGSLPALGCACYAALQTVASGGNAVSPEAQQIGKAVSAVMKSRELSQALFGDKALAMSQLWKLAKEYALRGGGDDENGAINQTAVFNAMHFLRVLPDGLQLPEFAIEPDGSISLDWIQSKARLFSLSVGASDRLAYAWLDGTDKGHGVARFDGQSVPPRVLDGITSIFNHGNSSIRAA